MKENLDPSEEWYETRSHGIGSSDIAVIAGLNSYQTIQNLWEIKCGYAEGFKGNEATKRGHRLEPYARDLYEDTYNVFMPPQHFIHPRYPWMRVNLDGWNENNKHLIEIKSPSSQKAMKIAKDGLLPNMYFAQIQYQLFVAQAQTADYVAFVNNKIYVKRVLSDLKFQRRLFLLTRWFWQKVQAKSEIKRYGIVLKPSSEYV